MRNLNENADKKSMTTGKNHKTERNARTCWDKKKKVAQEKNNNST